MLVYYMYRVQYASIVFRICCNPGYANNDSSRGYPEMSYDVLTKLRQ